MNKSESEKLIDAVSTLATLLEAENTALSNSDFTASGQFGDAKRAAIAQLEDAVSNARPATTRPRATRGAGLATLQQRLDTAVSQNRILLQRSIDTQQRVIATIVSALDPDGDVALYPAMEHACRSKPPVALTLSA